MFLLDSYHWQKRVHSLSSTPGGHHLITRLRFLGPTNPNLGIRSLRSRMSKSDFNQTDGEGNYSNELGGRSDAESHGTLFNSDPIPGQSQLADGANTIPSGTSIEAGPSNKLNAASKKMRKGKPGSSDGAKQKQKGKIHKFCKRYKNELTSLEAYNVFMLDKCDGVLKDLKRQKSIVDYVKNKCNAETDEVTELYMKLIDESG